MERAFAILCVCARECDSTVSPALMYTYIKTHTHKIVQNSLCWPFGPLLSVRIKFMYLSLWLWYFASSTAKTPAESPFVCTECFDSKKKNKIRHDNKCENVPWILARTSPKHTRITSHTRQFYLNYFPILRSKFMTHATKIILLWPKNSQINVYMTHWSMSMIFRTIYDVVPHLHRHAVLRLIQFVCLMPFQYI